jgi:cation-transporting ATPase F
VAVNTIVVVAVAYLFSCRSLRHPIWRIGWFANRGVWLGAAALLAAQVAMTYLPLMNRLFHTAPIAPGWWAAMTGVGFAVFGAAELKKAWSASRAT